MKTNPNTTKRITLSRFNMLLMSLLSFLIVFSACSKPAQPSTFAEILDLGEKYLLEMNYEQAAVQFLNAIEIEPKNASLYLKAAEAYIGLNDTGRAIALLEKGLAQLPDNEEIKLMLNSLIGSDNFLNEHRQTEQEMYIRYLINGGYDELIEYDFDRNNMEISSCLVDLDNDGTHELLLSLTETESIGPRGYPTATALLGIQEGAVKILERGYSGGGTMGGDFLELKYDTQENIHVLVLDGLLRDGMFRNSGYLHIYSSDNGTFNENIKIEREAVLIDQGLPYYLEEAESIKSETALHYDDEGFFVWYVIDGQYASEAEYEAMNNRFVNPIDDAYKWQSCTYENPIGVLNQ